MARAYCICCAILIIRIRNIINTMCERLGVKFSRAESIEENCDNCSIGDANTSEVFQDQESILTVRADVPFEQEPYFRLVNRATAEDMLRNRVDGSFLVRPYKEQSDSIKFITTVYAKEQFFHLYLRRIKDTGKYGMGQQKPDENQFDKPADIISFFRLHQLLCKNQWTSVKVFLVPIA